MGWDIIIGKAAPNVKWCGMNNREVIKSCEGEEPEGLTSFEYTREKGPYRYPRYEQWRDFMFSCDPLRELRQIFHYRASDGWVFPLKTDAVEVNINLLESVIPSLSPINQDRAKWLVFWVREAVSRYGDNSAIGFW